MPLWKKVVFAALACLGVLLLAEVALALLGVKPIQFERDPYVGFTSRFPLFVQDAQAKDPHSLITARNKQHLFNVQRFSERKPPHTFRIFCLGGSTAYGHPYDDRTSFAGWLRAMLPKADPSRRWEVINCGGISYASYREALLMEELIQYQPDLFIVLSGQNEFLEQRTYGNILSMPAPLRSAGAMLSHTRLHAAIQAGLGKLQRAPGRPSGTPASNALPAEVETLLERVVGPQAYHRDETWHRQVMEHFRYNLARMADIARSAGAQMIFINPASNLRNCAPFKSEHRAGLTEENLARWQEILQRARQAALENRWTDSLALIDQAAAIDDQFADLHFFRARVLWEQQQFDEARRAYIRARDEDVCPLRALSPMLSLVAEVAAQRGNTWVDFEKLLETKSEHATPGEDWFLDHVHPTIEGNRQLALAVLEKLEAQGLVRPAASWNEAAALEVKRDVEGQLTPATHGAALCTLAKVLAWAGKHDESYRVSLQAIRLAPEDAACYFEAGKNAAHLNRIEEARGYLGKAIELRPGFVEARALLGSVLSEQGLGQEAIRQCRDALARRPNDPELHCNLGTLLERDGQFNEAAASFRQALRLSPSYAEAHSNLAWVLKDQGLLTEALDHFREATRLKPGLASPAIGLAWLLATHPEEARRDPKLAVQLGERLAAQSDFKNWMSLDALAAAYAAAGRFDEAVRAAEKALTLIKPNNQTDLAAVEQRLKLYQARRPFRESIRPGTTPPVRAP